MKKIVVIAAISIAFLGVLATSASAAGRGNGGAGVRGGHWSGQSRGGAWHGGGARGGHWAAQSRGGGGWHGGHGGGWHGGGHGWHGQGWHGGHGHGWWGPRVSVGWPWYGWGYGYWPYAAYPYPYYGGYYGASAAYDSPTVVYTQPSATAAAPEVQREVVYAHGRYVLQGDGINSAYQWVWIPNPPSQPPPEQR